MRRRNQRSMGGRLLIWCLLLGLLVAGLLYLRCGDGLGFGPGGDGKERQVEEAELRPAVGNTLPCQLRVDAGGLTLDGQKAEIEGAIAACKQSGRAELLVTGDAVFGTVEEVKSALERAGVTLLVREPATEPRPTP